MKRNCKKITHKLEKTVVSFETTVFHGPSVEIRTRGLLNPIQARYQTSPHPDASIDCPSILAYRTEKCKYFFRLFQRIY